MPHLPRWIPVVAALSAAILAGALLAVLVTVVADAIGRPETSPGPVANASPTRTPHPTLPTSTPSPQPSPTVEPRATQVAASPSASLSISVAEGCFLEGAARPEVEGTEPVLAEDLANRMPDLDLLSEPQAWVGSSLTAGLGGAYVNGFASCTGADPATISFGAITVGSTLGLVPMAAQIVGYTGPELAEVLVRGLLTPEDARALSSHQHDGWTYRTDGGAFMVTASRDTVYWVQAFCCVDVMDPEAELPTFEEIIHDYLDRTNDEPAP